MTPALAITMSKGAPSALEPVGASANAGERGEIERGERETTATFYGSRTNARRRPLGLVEIAGGADDVGSMRSQRTARLNPKAGRRAGHQRALAAKIHAPQHFVRC
jgi:hypothetical protein